MTTARERREAAEILRRIVEDLPDLTPVQRAFMLGQASGLDEGVKPGERSPGDPAPRRRRDKHPYAE
jgi:hypothetical protein